MQATGWPRRAPCRLRWRHTGMWGSDTQKVSLGNRWFGKSEGTNSERRLKCKKKATQPQPSPHRGDRRSIRGSAELQQHQPLVAGSLRRQQLCVVRDPEGALRGQRGIQFTMRSYEAPKGSSREGDRVGTALDRTCPRRPRASVAASTSLPKPQLTMKPPAMCHTMGSGLCH